QRRGHPLARHRRIADPECPACPPRSRPRSGGRGAGPLETGGSAGAIVSWLARILASEERDVATVRERTRPSPGLGRRSQRDVVRTLQRGSSTDLRLIAEVKLRSPSAGALSRVLTAEDRAVAYAEAGAAMVSVLCDGPFFDGSWDHLSAARQHLDARF